MKISDTAKYDYLIIYAKRRFRMVVQPREIIRRWESIRQGWLIVIEEILTADSINPPSNINTDTWLIVQLLQLFGHYKDVFAHREVELGVCTAVISVMKISDTAKY